MTLKHITVTTRRGPISFTTDLEWDQALKLCAQDPSEFAQSLVRKDYLSQAQVNWVYKLAEDVRKPRQEDEPTTTLSTILDSLQSAVKAGLKKPAIRLVWGGQNLKISFMTSGKNEGGCWITLESSLMGKITPKGGLKVFNDIELDISELEDMSVPTRLSDFLVHVNDNYKDSVAQFGRMTNSCSFCGRKLTNPESIAMNMGPICASKYGV